MITRTFKLCLNAGTGSAPYINVSQYDEGETWLFELYSETGERYIPTTGAIVGVKSDGHGIVNTGTVDSEGRVVITETQQMTASAGRAIYELSIDGLTHGTANFIVAVERKPTDDAVMSDSDLSLIQEAIDSAEVIVEVIGDGDPSEVIGEHVDAWLDNHPEATTTVLDGAITAPKINQSLWDKLLVSEEASGTVASFEDGADDVPVSSLKVALEPIQTGTGEPSPSNVRPIIAANEKNVINADGMVNDNFVKSGNDYIFTQNGNGASARSTGYVPFSAVINEPYTFSFIIDNTGGMTNTFAVRVDYADETNEVIYSGTISSGHKAATFTPTKETTQIWMYSSSSTANVGKSITIKNIQLERGSSASAYQPYQGIMVEQTGKNITHVSSGNNIVIANCIKGMTYTFSLRNSGTCGFNLKKNSNSGQTVAGHLVASSPVLSATFTADEDFNLFLNGFGSGGGTFADAASEYQLEVGTEATEYEPFVSNSYPYTLGQSVYGGSVDLTTGVLTVTHVVADENSFTTLATGTSTGGLHWAEYITSDITTNGYALSNMVTRKDGDRGWASTSPCFAIGNLSKLRVYCAEGTLADFKTAYSGLQIVYPLATPQTIQLTPQEVKTLLGYNNISSSGTVDVIYHADTKLYVDKMTAVDNNIIAPTEADFVATRNYTTNDLVIVNDTLYKVTANIASGSTITPNSNVTATTLSALIKALS